MAKALLLEMAGSPEASGSSGALKERNLYMEDAGTPQHLCGVFPMPTNLP